MIKKFIDLFTSERQANNNGGLESMEKDSYGQYLHLIDVLDKLGDSEQGLVFISYLDSKKNLQHHCITIGWNHDDDNIVLDEYARLLSDNKNT